MAAPAFNSTPGEPAFPGTQLAGDVTPLQTPDPRRGTAEEWNKRLTRSTLMRALGGSQNVMPIKPDDK